MASSWERPGRASAAYRLPNASTAGARPDAAAASVPDWVPAAVLGAAGTPLFTRVSGKPLTEGISGFYTPEGFQTMLLHGLAATTKKVADESWVLGRNEAVPAQEPQIGELERGVVALYVADYEKQWDAMLGDLALAPFGDRAAAIQNLYVLASPQSPMRDLLVSIKHELSLVPTAAPAAEAGKGSASPQQSYLAGVVGAAPAAAAAPASPAGAAFEARYQPLRDFVGDGATAPIAGVLRMINALQQELAQLGPNTANIPATLQSSGDPVQLLLAEAQRQPQPVGRWLHQIAASGTAMLGGGAQDAASAAFSGSDGPDKLCQAVVTGHYPFDDASTQDAPLDDFARLFAPGGLLDSFFQAQIKPFVNTTGAVWRPQPLGGVTPPVAAATVAQFQRAAQIRDAFFPAGGTQPQIRFSIKPDADDAGAKQATLTLGGTTVAAGKAAAPETALVWPGADGMSVASLAFDPPVEAAPTVRAEGNMGAVPVVRKGSDRAGRHAGGFQPGLSIRRSRGKFRSAGRIVPQSVRAESPEGFPLSDASHTMRTK